MNFRDSFKGPVSTPNSYPNSCRNSRIELDNFLKNYSKISCELRLFLKAGANVKTIFELQTKKMIFFIFFQTRFNLQTLNELPFSLAAANVNTFF